ncbi:MAG: DUF1700 domain-containing protein [Erysipelotrichaceae bacterium]|nr:DUF1700 domain-containing protein [Erysipelotrichaceae bacterium]MCI9523477.1 DUF1700 domain-containing protein [Erysipelotrichaceae bacterium]
MNKEQFITYMNKKLAVIKEEERKDIIDEYINHIDMKVQEGISEEEAIAAFGDIDEMIKEILDAYNIDPKQANSFDHKLNDWIDQVFIWFQNILSSFTGMDVDNVVKLVFEILIVLIVLAIVHIPFEIVSSIGGGVFRSLLGSGIGSLMSGLWHLFINLIYLVLFLSVLVHVATKRWAKWKDGTDTPIMDDVKESLRFEQAKEAVHRFTDTGEKKEKRNEEQKEYTQSTATAATTSSMIFSTILKIIGYLIALPFILAIIGLFCALGFLIQMSVQGVTIIGFYLVIIGSIIGCWSIVSLIERVLCKGGRKS